jgi:hypothetical protein
MKTSQVIWMLACVFQGLLLTIVGLNFLTWQFWAFLILQAIYGVSFSISNNKGSQP